ncbi:MAG: monofunctional biosynthetic peptidoglycan transglycosylase [Thermoanaerobaculia bacterium]
MFKRVLLGVLAVAVAYVLYVWITFPDVSRLAKEAPKTTAFMEARRADLRREGKDDHLDYRGVPYSRISASLRRAVLVAEDSEFYEHEGVDVEAMREALRRDWKRKKITHGGSTITQQLAKNLYLSPSRNPVRKIKEYFLARSLENHLSKKRILELYLNVVEMGERIYGAEAAAQNYFGIPASALSPSQAALLAGCLPNPRVMNPGDPNGRLRARQRMIVSRMRRWGYVAEEETEVEKPAPVEAPAPPPAVETDTTATETVPTETTATETTGTTATTTDTAATETTSTEPPPP